MVSDHDRRELYTTLTQALGEGPASTMMELLPPDGWTDLARQSDLVAIRGEMAELRGELKGEMSELRGEMSELRGKLDSMLPKLIAANIASMVGVSGLVLAAANFA